MKVRRRHGIAVLAASVVMASGLTLPLSPVARASTAAPPPELVKDINEDNGGEVPSSSPSDMTVFDGRVYMAATAVDSGRELWRSDGTTAGTELVADINPGPAPSNPSNLIVFAGHLYFTATDDVGGTQLWRTDGTTTAVVKDLIELPYDVAPDEYNPRPDPDPKHFTVSGDLLFFTSRPATPSCPYRDGPWLWRTDGTPEGTYALVDFFTDSCNSLPSPLVPQRLTDVDGTLFFTAFHRATLISGGALWTSDGTVAGTVRVAGDNTNGPNRMSDLRSVGGWLLFHAAGPTGTGLWRSDGTTTNLMVDFDPTSTSGNDTLPRLLSVHNGEVYVSAYDGVSPGLYRSDGTDVVLVKNIFALYSTSTPEQVSASIGDRLYFVANPNLSFSSYQLWRTDGTSAGTEPAGAQPEASYGFFPLGVGPGVVFYSADPVDGARLLHTDATATEPVPVSQLAPPEASPVVTDIVVLGSNVLLGYDAGNGLGTELYRVPVDADLDGVIDLLDNCTTTANADQNDNDGDGNGDACDPNDDNDDILDAVDDDPFVAGTGFADVDEARATVGTVTNKPNGFLLTIGDAPAPGGVTIDVVAGPGADPTKKVTIKLTGKAATYKFPPGHYVLTDPALDATVETLADGPAEVELVVDGVTTVVLVDAGETALITEHENGTISVAAIAGTVTVNGQPVAPGQTLALGHLVAKLKLSIASRSFELAGTFQPASNRTISPTSEATTIRVGTFTATVPAGSFKALTKGRFAYSGTPPGSTAALDVQLAPITGGGWTIAAKASNASLIGTTNPVTVAFGVGDDQSSTKVTAKFA